MPLALFHSTLFRKIAWTFVLWFHWTWSHLVFFFFWLSKSFSLCRSKILLNNFLGIALFVWAIISKRPSLLFESLYYFGLWRLCFLIMKCIPLHHSICLLLTLRALRFYICDLFVWPLHYCFEKKHLMHTSLMYCKMLYEKHHQCFTHKQC